MPGLDVTVSIRDCTRNRLRTRGSRRGCLGLRSGEELEVLIEAVVVIGLRYSR